MPVSTVLERASALRRVLEEQAAQAVGPASAASVQLGESIPATLRQGATAADASAARFLALLECTYLVAAADSITTEELGGLSTMVEVVTGARLSPPQIQNYFREFARGLADEGRLVRLRSIANTLGGPIERQEALHLAVLFAVADGTLARKETRVLIEVAEAFDHSIDELQAVIDEVASLLRTALKS